MASRYGNDCFYDEMGNALYVTPSRGKINRIIKVTLKFHKLKTEYFQIQSHCRTEIHAALGRDTSVTLSDRQRTPYTMATVNEIQRMSNIVTINLFHNTTKVWSNCCLNILVYKIKEVTIGGYVIPANMDVIPQISAVLNDPDVFDKPDEFRPERFLMADMKTANRDAIENVCVFTHFIEFFAKFCLLSS